MNSGIYRQRSYDNLQNGKSPLFDVRSMSRISHHHHLPQYSNSTSSASPSSASMISANRCEHNLLPYSLAIGGGGADAFAFSHTHLQQEQPTIPTATDTTTPTIPSSTTQPLEPSAPPVPTDFRYFSPQQRKSDHYKRNGVGPSLHSRYPYHKNRAVSRRHIPSLMSAAAVAAAASDRSSSTEEVRLCMDLNSPTQQLQNVYQYSRHNNRSSSRSRYQNQRSGNRHHNHHHHHHQASALSLLKDLDFIDSCEDDPMLKNHNQFRVTKQSGGGGGISSDRSPLKKKQRYSNIYDYSFNLSLNSIYEDSTSDDSL